MFLASIFQTLVVGPVFNLLVLVYGLLPGHNFGLSIIIFTIIIRLLMWPLVRKQLHHAKAMRTLQPEIKKIKQATKGNRQQESQMLMELYKERGISPFGSLGTLFVQLVILIGLYSGLSKVVNNPQAFVDSSYEFLKQLPGLRALTADISLFDSSLFGLMDLKRPALAAGGIYYPALALVLGSAVAQYFQSKQLMPQSKEQKTLRTILKDAGSGKQAEQSEVTAAVGRGTRWLIPLMIIMFTISIPSALSLYWLMSGIVAYAQQAKVLGQDEDEMEKLGKKSTTTKTTIIEGEVVSKPKSKSAKKKSKGKKRR